MPTSGMGKKAGRCQDGCCTEVEDTSWYRGEALFRQFELIIATMCYDSAFEDG